MVVKLHMCKFFEEGRCQRSKYCAWAHSREQIGQKVKDPQNLKTTLCKYFDAGNCRKNSEECEFAHGRQELGLKKPEVPANQKKGGKEGKKGKIKGGGKMKNTDRPGEGKRSRAHGSDSKDRRARRSPKGSRARRSDSRSQVLLIIIQTCSLFPLHQDKTLSAK